MSECVSDLLSFMQFIIPVFQRHTSHKTRISCCDLGINSDDHQIIFQHNMFCFNEIRTVIHAIA